MFVWFAETSLVATVLALVALLAGRWLRLRPAARHALWLMVLVKLIAPPVVTWPWASPLVLSGFELAEAPNVAGRAAADWADPTKSIPEADATARMDSNHMMTDRLRLPDLATLGRGAIVIWACATAALVLRQIARVIRFRRRFRWAVPAPGWLEDEARRVGRRLGASTPEILVLPGAASPMLWFLGRPKLLVPASLVETLGAAAWRGILAHELAHLVRRDHWVRRLELAAGLFWWWNPLYWLTRRRLDFEAELACDEWAVGAFPEGRLAYAEALLEVCRSLSTAKLPVPALGVAGSGQSLERRVTMILSERNPARASTWVLVGAGLLAILAQPGWSASASDSPKPDEPPAALSAPAATSSVPDDDADAPPMAVDDDDDEKPSTGSRKQDPSPEDDAKKAAEAERAKVRAERAAASLEKAKAAAAVRQAAKAERAKKKAEAADTFGKKAKALAAAKQASKADRDRKIADEAAVAEKRAVENGQAKKKADESATLDKKRAEEIAKARKAAERETAAAVRQLQQTERARKLADKKVALDKKRAEDHELAKQLADKAAASREAKAGKGGNTGSGSGSKPKSVADGSRKKPTRAQRIRDLQSLIDKLQVELKALESEYKD